MLIALALTAAASAAECTGDIEIVLQDAVKTDRDNDRTLDGVLTVIDLIPFDLDLVAKLALHPGLKSDAWKDAGRWVADDIAKLGVDGTVAVGGLRIRSELTGAGWLWMDGGHPLNAGSLIGASPDDLAKPFDFTPFALYVHLNDPVAAARAVGRPVGATKLPHLTANLNVVLALYQPMMQQYMFSWVHPGGDACGES